MQEKEEAERLERLNEWESGGRIDPIPIGVRVEAKWLDEQFRTFTPTHLIDCSVFGLMFGRSCGLL